MYYFNLIEMNYKQWLIQTFLHLIKNHFSFGFLLIRAEKIRHWWGSFTLSHFFFIFFNPFSSSLPFCFSIWNICFIHLNGLRIGKLQNLWQHYSSTSPRPKKKKKKKQSFSSLFSFYKSFIIIGHLNLFPNNVSFYLQAVMDPWWWHHSFFTLIK